MRILVDTNILLRAIQHESQCLTPQNVREFWNVCTRPTDHNGLGISVSGTERRARFLERYFIVLPDSALTYSTWRQLVTAHNVLGVKGHDAFSRSAEPGLSQCAES